MDEISVLGEGHAARRCRELLAGAGFAVRPETTDEPSRAPLVLGETPQAFATAWQAFEAGRHILLAAPQLLSAPQLDTLLASRRARQAVVLWSERRFHPAYRMLSGLVQAGDSTWEPRYVRQTTLSGEPVSGALMRWRVIEALLLALDLAAATPVRLSATSAVNPGRHADDFVSVSLSFEGIDGFVQVGLGEGLERRESLLAAANRKAYVDEMNPHVPLRLVEDDPPDGGGAARWVSCPAQSDDHLARQQCAAFLELTQQPALAAIEADVWRQALSVWRAAEASIAAGGRPVDIQKPESTGLRVLEGGRRSTARALVPDLRAV